MVNHKANRAVGVVVFDGVREEVDEDGVDEARIEVYGSDRFVVVLHYLLLALLLLIVVIGGMGTMYGAAIGAAIFVVAQNYLQEAMKAVSDAAAGLPLIPDLFHPDRWLLWLGVLFVLSVYYFPFGIVGQLRARALKK